MKIKENNGKLVSITNKILIKLLRYIKLECKQVIMFLQIMKVQMKD